MVRPSVYLLPTKIGRILAQTVGRPELIAPILIGATGGSGTRLLRDILESAGVFMGAGDGVNFAGDAMVFEPFLDEFINPILLETGSLDYQISDLSPQLRQRALHTMRQVLRDYLTTRPRTALLWGWKNPRTMYVMPIIRHVLPNLKFIHLVRDGRDMSVSKNQVQFLKHFAALFAAAPPVEGDSLSSFRLWCKANGDAAANAARHSKDTYLQVRFEDLVSTPNEEVARILNFVGSKNGGAEYLAAIPKRPESLGRWRHELDELVLQQMIAENGDELRRLGYEVEK